MTEAPPIACSLSAGDLKQRLTAIAEVGGESLIDRTAVGGRHLLRFRADAATRGRLEEIVAAEARCCSFLDLVLEQRGAELVLTIAAPEGGGAIADDLAAAFGGPPGDPSPHVESARRRSSSG
jgi:hypothetical protein